jgi:hypothetical protein
MIYGVLGIDFIIPEIKRDAGFLERRFLGQFAQRLACLSFVRSCGST